VIDLVAVGAALAACASGVGFLLGRETGERSASSAVSFLRADNAKLRSRLVATERELYSERSRRAQVFRVIRGSRSGSGGDEAS
jgi:hypothetical protein